MKQKRYNLKNHAVSILLSSISLSTYMTSASNNGVVVDFNPATKTPPSYVFGGYSLTSALRNNTVQMNSGTISENIFCGRSDSGSATDNIRRRSHMKQDRETP